MSTTNRPRVLLSSVCQPFGMKYGDGFGVSSEGTHQIMWAQDIFRVRATTTQWGIDFIAANLQAQTTTLHYPTLKQFTKELKRGYDYVGIAFISATYHKLLPMLEQIRKVAPQTKIILGGYGTVINEDLQSMADYVCQEEGVTFMRRILGEPLDRPICQPDITQKQTLFSIPLPGETGYVFAGLGCPNGCDFCATSHYFKRRHIQFLKDGPAIVKAMNDLRISHPGIDTFWINDEDFLLNHNRGKSFLEAVRESTLPALSLSAFGSVKALSQYDPKELVEMGIDWVWVGYEGKRAGYSKMKGKSYKELFDSFRQHGISILASMIIGFDYQTPEIIMEEFEDLMKLNPTMSQFLIYGPAPQTPLLEKLKAENRLDEAVMKNRQKQDGFTLGFRHPHIDRPTMSKIQRNLYHEEFRRLGPSVFRVVETMLEGYQNLKASSTPRIQSKAERLGKTVHDAMILIKGSRHAVSENRRPWLDRLYREIKNQTGPMTFAEQVQSRLVPQAISFTQFKLKHDIGQQPTFTKRHYRWEPAKQAKTLRLPGLRVTVQRT